MSSVDVIVPCYNYAHYLQECVESVLGQSHSNVRVLIIDDASPDDTADVATDIAAADARVAVISHKRNKGHIATYNEGIEWASADYMLILSADDYLLAGALARAAELLDAHDDVGFTFGRVIERDDEGIETFVDAPIRGFDRLGHRIMRGSEFIATNKANCIVATCAAVVRTEMQKRVGGYRPELPHAGDFEMWLRFAAHGSVGFVNARQGVYRRHRTNMSWSYYANGLWGDLQQRRRAIDCFVESCRDVLPDAEGQREKLLRALSIVMVGHASDAFNKGDMDTSARLSELALATYPHIDQTPQWFRLTIKKRIGRRAWSALRPAVAALRGERLDRR